MNPFAILKAYLWLGAALLLAGVATTQTWRLSLEQTAHAKLRADVATDKERRTTAALKYEVFTASKESTHAADTSKNAEEFTMSQPVRDAIARADVARADRLRASAESRAATYRAMAEAGAAACSDLADRHAALDRHLVEGVAVVAGLREAVDRRDAEVALLRRQIDVDRALFAESNPGRSATGATESNP